MHRFRFVTPHRTGKWYSDLGTAQRHACEIGAGFLDPLSGSFYPYLGTRLESELSPAAALLTAADQVAA